MSAAGRTRRLARRVDVSEAGSPLLDLLAAWLPPLLGAAPPRARVRAMVAAGAVRVDGTQLRAPGRPLRAGQRVEAVLRLDDLRPAAARSDRRFTMDEAAVLYRDASLLAVDKPPGLPTHPTADPLRPSLVSAVEDYLSRERRPAYLAVHQRLDRDTSGVVLFAVDPAANAALSRAFAEHRVEKAYLALTVRPLRSVFDRLTIDQPLVVARDGRVAVSGPGAKALPARTDLLVRERLARVLLVEARPATGRKHQVRVHLAHAGMAVLGDSVYGREKPVVPRLMLHAWRLVLPHPLSGRRLVLESPLPPDFAAALRAARSRRR